MRAVFKTVAAYKAACEEGARMIKNSGTGLYLARVIEFAKGWQNILCTKKNNKKNQRK